MYLQYMTICLGVNFLAFWREESNNGWAPWRRSVLALVDLCFPNDWPSGCAVAPISSSMVDVSLHWTSFEFFWFQNKNPLKIQMEKIGGTLESVPKEKAFVVHVLPLSEWNHTSTGSQVNVLWSVGPVLCFHDLHSQTWTLLYQIWAWNMCRPDKTLCDTAFFLRACCHQIWRSLSGFLKYLLPWTWNNCHSKCFALPLRLSWSFQFHSELQRLYGPRTLPDKWAFKHTWLNSTLPFGPESELRPYREFFGFSLFH